MPMSQTDLKFLKRRKYHQANVSNSCKKLEFDLKTKNISEMEEQHFSRPVSSKKILSHPNSARAIQA
jgi:hypothetical protein